jgi:hypothetical protein
MFGADLCDVACDGVLVGVVFSIGDLGVGVPFTSEYALSTLVFKSPADAANASKQVNEGEGGRRGFQGCWAWVAGLFYYTGLKNSVRVQTVGFGGIVGFCFVGFGSYRSCGAC